MFDDEEGDDDGVCVCARARSVALPVSDVEAFVEKITPSCNIRPCDKHDALQSGHKYQPLAFLCWILRLF